MWFASAALITPLLPVCGQCDVEDVLTEIGLAVVSHGDAATLKSQQSVLALQTHGKHLIKKRFSLHS